ncbi:MAG: GNAT family N-acetyltransferase [Candidatus Kapaibacterium sp.]
MKINPIEDIQIKTDRLLLRVLQPADAPKITRYLADNRDFFIDFLPTVGSDYFTEQYQINKLWLEFDLMTDQRALRFYLFKKDDYYYDEILGDIFISNILRGSSQSCVIGYKTARKHTGRGFMKEALGAAADYIFNTLGLMRIEANILPDNTPSLRLVRGLGFAEEGPAYKYMKIRGEWRDHVRFSLINPKIPEENNE